MALDYDSLACLDAVLDDHQVTLSLAELHRPQLGGRATAFRDRHTGELVDNGQHVLFGCYRETLAFLKLVGADDRVPAVPVATYLPSCEMAMLQLT